MSSQNRLRDELKVQNGGSLEHDAWAEGWKGDDEVERRRELGDRHPAWRYRL